MLILGVMYFLNICWSLTFLFGGSLSMIVFCLGLLVLYLGIDISMNLMIESPVLFYTLLEVS